MDQGPIRPLSDPNTPPVGSHFSARPVVRGPSAGVFKRVVILCFKPEAWADMARYPLRYTIGTVLLAVILSALLTAIAAGRTLVHELAELAGQYDRHFATLTFNDGKLSAPEGTHPDKLPRFELGTGIIVVDPTGKTRIEDLPENSVLFDETTIHVKEMGTVFHDTESYKKFAKMGMANQKINGLALKRFVSDIGGALGTLCGIVAFFVFLLSNGLWALVIGFLTSPLARIAAPNLRMPRGMPYRISGAITVPLLILGGVLELIGHPPRSVLGAEGAALFWFFAAAAMAFWAGYLLNRHALEALRRTRGE